MKRYIRSDSAINYEYVRDVLSSMKKNNELHYDKIARRASGVRLAYANADIRDSDYSFLQDVDLAGSPSIVTDDDAAPVMTPYYIRLEFNSDVYSKERSVVDSDFVNVLPEDKAIMKDLAAHDVFRTLSNYQTLQLNSNYPDDMKLIELRRRNADSNVYGVPYNQRERVYEVEVTVYSDGTVSIGNHEPVLTEVSYSKLRKQFNACTH